MKGSRSKIKGEIKIKEEVEDHEYPTSSIKIEPDLNWDQEFKESNYLFVSSGDIKTEIVDAVKSEVNIDAVDHEDQYETQTTSFGKFVERKSYQCGTCGEVFQKLTIFVKHLKTHGASEKAWEKSLFCDMCEKPFLTLSNLNRHRSSSHKIHHKSIATEMLEDCLGRFTKSGLKIDVGSDEQNSNREAYMVSIGNYRKRRCQDKNDQHFEVVDASRERPKKKSYYKKKGRPWNAIDFPEGTDKKQYFLALEKALQNRKKKV